MYTLPKEVKFHPWIGKDYGRDSRFDVRLLVLGGSHYGEKQESTNTKMTEEVVHTWGQQERHRFFTIVAKALLGREDWINDKDRGEVWVHFAFYNFIQSLKSGPRNSPTHQQWRNAETPFKTVLQTVKPDGVLILGLRLNEHVSDRVRPCSITFQHIPHPASSRFRYAEVIPVVKQMLADSRQRIGQD